MPEQSEYGPIDRMIETSGDDIGRVKDIDFAKDIAKKSDSSRDNFSNWHPGEDPAKAGIEEHHTRDAIIERQMGYDLGATKAAAHGEAAGGNHEYSEPGEAAKLLSQAIEQGTLAAASYDRLQKDAELANTKRQLEDARKTIAEHESER